MRAMSTWMNAVLQLNGDGLAPGANHEIRFNWPDGVWVSKENGF